MSDRTSRKSKTIAIPLNRPEGLAAAQMGDEELKTDAEKMVQLINEVNTEEDLVAEPLAVEEELVAEPLAMEDAPKTKAKRAPRAKAKAALEPEVEAVLFEATQEVKTERKVVDKVKCPDCGKQISAKTLRYSHTTKCTAKKNRQE